MKNTLEIAIQTHLARGINPNCEVFKWWSEQTSRLDGLDGEDLENEEWLIRVEMTELPAWKAVQTMGAYDALTTIPRPQQEPRKTETELLFINKLLETYENDPRTRHLIRSLIGRAETYPGFLSKQSLNVLTNFDRDIIEKDSRQRKYINPNI